MPRVVLSVIALLLFVHKAHSIDINVDNIGILHIISQSIPVTVYSENRSQVSLNYPDGCTLIAPESSIITNGGILVLDLSFHTDGSTGCNTVINIPSRLVVSLDASAEDVAFIGAASSLTAQSDNASITIQDTGTMLINATARNGSINVFRSFGPLTLETSNGDTKISESDGPFLVRGGNNDVTITKSSGSFSIDSTNGLIKIKKFKFDPSTRNTINADNGSVRTARLRTRTLHGRKRGLLIRARAFSSIKFPKENLIDSFPGKKWYTRKLIPGDDEARLIIDAGSKLTMR